MKISTRAACLAVSLALAGPAAADLSAVPAGSYGLDKTHGYITFTYSHLGFSNPRVGFDAFDVALDLDNEAPENSSLEVMIDAASINSRVEEFDEHLNGDKFFDTGEYPNIDFQSTGIEQTGDDTFRVNGNLTIKGVTRAVTLDAKINKAATHPLSKTPTVGVSATTSLLRSEWSLGDYVPMVSDRVEVEIEVELPKLGDQAP